MANLIHETRQGDSFSLDFDLQNYPAAEGYALDLLLRGPAAIDIEAENDGSQYQVSATPAETAEWTPGDYWAFVQVSLAGEVKTVELGQFKILPNLADLQTLDNRSHVKKVLDALESLLEGKATSDVSQYSIGNRQLSKMAPSELLKWKNHYSELYRREQAEEARKAGKKSKNKVFVRFT